MQVQAVHRVPRHDIDPAIGHFEFAAVKIPFNRAAKGRDMTFELSPQRIEGGRYALQAMHRPVGDNWVRVPVTHYLLFRSAVPSVPFFFFFFPVPLVSPS